MTTWRTGRKVGRTIYRDDVLIGLMDTVILADQVVDAVNVQLNPVATQRSLDSAYVVRIKELESLVRERDEQLKAVMPVDPQSANQRIQEYKQALAKANEKITLLYQEVGEMGSHIAEQTDVILREEKIHNEAAQGMIDRVKELEKVVFGWKKVVDEQNAVLQSMQNLINKLNTKNAALKRKVKELRKEQEEAEHFTVKISDANDRLQKERDSLKFQVASEAEYWGHGVE